MTFGKALILWLLNGVVVAVSAAATPERPMPNDKAVSVSGIPRLFWNQAAQNLLSNGGFEEGSTGWTGGTIVTQATASLKPFEGTNYYRVGPSTYPFGLSLRANRTVTLPATSDRILWSFAAVTWLSSVRANVLSANREALLSQSFTNVGSLPGWTTYSVDLSELSGQTVELQLIQQVGDGGISLYVDDVRLTVQPRDVVFDVYLDGIGLGRTTNNWWQLKDLRPDTVYKWHVDAIEAGVTNRSPLWSFTTATSDARTDIAFGEISPRVCPNTLTMVEAFLRDGRGLRNVDQSRIFFSAIGDDAVLPGVLITELDTGEQDAIELMNASTNTINMNRWMLQIYAPSNSFPSQIIRFPTNAILEPGQICTVTEGATTAWPQIGMNKINWGDTGVLQAGVALRTVTSNLIDCVFIDLTSNSNGYHNVHLSTALPEFEWRSGAITNVSNGLTYQRTRSRDLNVRDDWGVGAGSIGAINPGLSLPFELGFGIYSADWSFSSTTKSGVGVTKTVGFPRPAQNVRYYAQHFPNGSLVRDAYGLSAPFDVVEPEFCLALLGPSEVREVDGTIELRVTIAAAVASDLVLHLRSSHPLAATIPETVTIPAGATEAMVTAQILDNNLVEGRKAIAFFAEAENYTAGILPITITDDEIPTLSFVGPFSVVEGDRTRIAIEASRAPDTNVVIHVTSSPNRGVRNCLLEAGKTQTSFEIFNDYNVDGDVWYHFKAGFQDWVLGEADIFVDDDESTALSIVTPIPALPGTIGEGQIGTGSVGLVDFAARDIEVQLTSNDPSLLDVVNKVVIAANQKSADFTYRVLASDLPPGPRTVSLTASATGFESAISLVPIVLYPPAPRLNVTLTSDGLVVITFNAEPGMHYGVLDLTELSGGLYDGIEPEISNGVGRFTFPVNGEQHYFFVAGAPQ
jgi:hypothetical protein